MPKMIQIRNVPDEVHRELRLRAVREGISLSEYMLRLAKADVSRPSMREVLDRIASRPPMGLGKSSAELVREDRDSH